MPADQFTSTFAALADPSRRAILAHLMSGEASVKVLAEPFEMSLPAISKHQKVLEDAGLIARSHEAQWRPCRIQPAPLKDLRPSHGLGAEAQSRDFKRTPQVAAALSGMEQGWSESLYRLADHLEDSLRQFSVKQ